uniref:Retrotransposon gag domain-containing protein n=1 Tax=Ananas comosus var. bracteatus TaxID=296719 RepID=A0A6V7Q3I2_ANACO|nr:unnamed protein product [Ananas comosus var. bracteatus]
MNAAHRQEDRMKRLEDLLLRQTTDREIPEPIPTVPDRDATVRAQSPVPDTLPVAPRVEPRQETVVPPPVHVAAAGTVLPYMVGVEERERMMERLNEFRHCNPRVFDGEKADHWVVEKWLMHMEKLFYDTFVEERYRVCDLHCVPFVVRDDEDKARIFEVGLRPAIFRLVKASNLSTYKEVVNRALIVEKEAEIMKERDIVDRSKGKRPAADSSGQQSLRNPPNVHNVGASASFAVRRAIFVQSAREVLPALSSASAPASSAPSQGTPTAPSQYRRSPGQRQSQSPRQGSSGRMYAAQTEEAAAAEEVVAGIIMLYDVRVRALFDTGASHSFIDRQFA